MTDHGRIQLPTGYDGFVAKLDSGGNVVYTRFLHSGDARRIAIDSSGSA
ncbi:MAG TPA: hypothetical protein VF711_02690 [Acidimicrobiales bacterium]